jgi:molecular chaperone GrpE
MTEETQRHLSEAIGAESFSSPIEHMENESKFAAMESAEMESAEMKSAETNLPELNPPTDSVPNSEETLTVQTVDAESENFTLDPDVEPFDLSPDASATDEEIEAATQSGAQSSPQTAGLQATIAELNQSIESLKSQLEDRSTQYMRLAADFENFRKRTQKEKEEQEEQVKCSTVKELLPVVDNFERARTQLKPQTEPEMVIHKSYQGVYRQLVDAMKKLGVSAMSAEGQEFDPNLHEAVMREATDAYPEGAIMEELMRGYVLGDRVLRHAMVKVAAAPDADNASESE